MVQCPQKHTLRKQPAKNDTKCDSCSEIVKDDSEAYRCGACDYDLCAGCFNVRKHQQKPKGTSLVKQGVLKKSKKAVASGSGVQASTEAFQFFAFSGFPVDSDAYEVFCLVQQFVQDLLGEFQLSVLGTTVSDGAMHVGVRYREVDAEALDKQLYDKRDSWVYNTAFLNTWTVDHPEVFVAPALGTSAAAASAAAATASMDTDEFDYFALGPFVGRSSDAAVVSLVREYLHDFLGEFSTEVFGISRDYVGFRIPKGQSEDFQKQAHVKRDSFVFNGQVLLSKTVDPAEVGAYVLPAMAPGSPRGDPLSQNDPWSKYMPTKRSEGAHSGMTPDLDKKRLTLDEFLTVAVPPVLPALPVPPPLPGKDRDPMLAVILEGVNEIRANAVTKDVLKSYHDKLSDEFKTYVLAETAPLHTGMQHLSEEVAATKSRLSQLEARMDSGQSGPGTSSRRAFDENDPAFKQIAFTGFKIDDLKVRVQVLKEFAASNFPDIQIANVETIMNGPWKGRKATSTVVMEFFSRDSRDQALEAAKNKKVLDAKGQALDLKIERARTRSQRSRNWALRKAEELAKVHAQQRGISGTAWIDWTMPVRKVFVGDELAFSQQRGELRGSFVDKFSSLVLPP